MSKFKTQLGMPPSIFRLRARAERDGTPTGEFHEGTKVFSVDKVFFVVNPHKTLNCFVKTWLVRE